VTVAWLWLFGPPGVGKSATGFEIFEQLVDRGARVAFVELDQIGMCMPQPVAKRSAAKAANLLGMLDNFAEAGAHGVVVSGDIVEAMRDLLPLARVQPVLCRLRADDDTTIERLTKRESLQWAMSSSVYESYDVPIADIDVITHPLAVDEVAGEILRRLGPWPPDSPTGEVRAPLAPIAMGDDCSAILVTGPRAVGTSMVAWRVLMASLASGHCTGYLDLEQLGFLSPSLKDAALATTLANVATCWAGLRDNGAARLVLCGHLDGREMAALRELIPSLRVVALTATPDTLLERARRRSQQKDIWLPGDDLFGRDDAYLRQLVRRAEAFHPEPADLVVATDGFSPEELAVVVTELWPDMASTRRSADV
jgi:gluconate kinase